MAKKSSSTPSTPLTRLSKAITKPVTIKLCDLDHLSGKDQYCHRNDSVFVYKDEDNNAMKSMMDSLLLEGQNTPVEYYVDLETGAKVQIKGFRRTHACHKAIALHYDPAHFFAEMELQAIEVYCPDPVEYLIRSITDNTVRLNLNDEELVGAAGKLLDKKVPLYVAAQTFNMSPTLFARYVRRWGSPNMREYSQMNISQRAIAILC